MSDVELEKAEKKDGGSIFKGPDGQWSLRRISGASLILTGIGFLAWAMTMVFEMLKVTSWIAVIPFAPGVFLVLAGLYSYKIFTTQNIKEILGKDK